MIGSSLSLNMDITKSYIPCFKYSLNEKFHFGDVSIGKLLTCADEFKNKAMESLMATTITN